MGEVLRRYEKEVSGQGDDIALHIARADADHAPMPIMRRADTTPVPQAGTPGQYGPPDGAGARAVADASDRSLIARAADPADILAEDRIADVLAWSLEHHGEAGMARYAALILQPRMIWRRSPAAPGSSHWKASSGLSIAAQRTTRANSARGQESGPLADRAPVAGRFPLLLSIVGKGALPEKHARIAERDVRRSPGFASER